MSDERVQHSHRDRLAVHSRQSEQPSAGLGEVARDVVDHAQIIARDAIAIGKLETRRAVDRAKERAKEIAPRIAFGAIAAVAALTGTVFLLIAIFLALGGPIPSVAWRTAIFGVFFLVVAVIAAIFADTKEKLHEERPRRVLAEVEPPSAASPRTGEQASALTRQRH